MKQALLRIAAAGLVISAAGFSNQLMAQPPALAPERDRAPAVLAARPAVCREDR